MLPDHRFLERRAPSDVDDQPRDEVTQIKAPVEPVGEGGKVVCGVLAVLQRVIGPGQRGLQIAQDCVHPQELRQVARLAIADNHRLVFAAGDGHGGEATQTVAGDHAARRQTCLGPLADGLGREAADHAELQESGPVLVVQRHRSHERHLALRAAPGLAAGALATEVGVVDLHGPFEPMAALAPSHRAIDLLVQQPSGGVAHAELALERQRRQARLGLADQIDGQEPGGQRQLGVLHQAARGQRGLVPAGDALEQVAGAVADHVVRLAVAARTAEAPRPTCSLQRLGAVRLRAEAAKELGQGHAGLELDSVERHGVRSVFGCTQVTRAVAHQVSLAEADF